MFVVTFEDNVCHKFIVPAVIRAVVLCKIRKIVVRNNILIRSEACASAEMYGMRNRIAEESLL
jgi:hypothetical protein